MKPKSTRAPFAPRPFLLVNSDVVARIQALLANVPIDPIRPLQVLIREAPTRRNNGQNALYWVRLGEIAEQAYLSGRQYSPDCWHEYARQNIMPTVITTHDGVMRSKYEELPDGSTTVISTTQLDKASFALLITALEAFGANLGVNFSASPMENQ